MSGPAATAVRERPAPPAANNGGAPARRAVLRWAWRLFRREWRQQLLVLALITVAVAATVLAGGIATNTPPPLNPTFGTAQHLVTLPGSDPRLAADIAAIRAHFGTVEVVAEQDLVTGSVNPIVLRAQDPAGRYRHATLALVSGRYPTGPAEVAVTAGVAARFGLSVGGGWQEAGRALHVVGVVRDPVELLEEFALVAPGQLGTASRVRVLFDGADPDVLGFAFPAGATPQQPPAPSSGISPAIVVLVVAAFGLLFVGLVSVAGFSVLGQRRLRALGMLGSLGATDRNIRLVMVANGAVVGAVAALVGAAVGFAGWLGYAPHLQTSAGHVIDPMHLPWPTIGTAMVLAVGAATLAARRPARLLTQVPVVAALSGRPATPKPSHRSAVPGLVLLGIGLVFVVLGGPNGSSTGSPGKVLPGLLAVTLGGLLFTPLAITGLAALGRRAPLAVRLALRDLDRYRARSGAALAAVSLAITIAVIVCLAASARYANVLDYVGPNLRADQVVLHAPETGKGGPGAAPAPAQQARLQADVTAVGAALGTSDVLGLTATEATLYRTSGGPQNFNGRLDVATPEVLRYYGIAPADVDPAADILTSRPGLAAVRNLVLFTQASLVADRPTDPSAADDSLPRCTPPSCIAAPKIQTLRRLPTETSAPNVLITERALQALGLRAGEPDTWLVRAPHPLTALQKNTAEQLAAAAGMTVETKNDNPSLASLNNYATGAGILLALGVLAMTTGLIRSETAGDLRTLAATGASSRTRRGITAATAGALGLLGGLLGTAIGTVGVVAFFRSRLGPLGGNIPVGDLLVIIVGLPLAAAIGGWLFAGREPPAIAHQPIE